MEFKNIITKVIEYSGMAPAEFAEEIGVQRSSISHIVSGRNKPSLDFITKIKTSFPNLEWNWLITGSGDMVKRSEENSADKDEETNQEKKEKKSLPDLFSLINDEEFGYTEKEDKIQKQNPSESDISPSKLKENKIFDSQPLDNFPKKQVSESKKIRRIVFFFDDGTFETYEN